MNGPARGFSVNALEKDVHGEKSPVTNGHITMLDGSLLFSMERLLATAASIEAALLNLGL